MDLNAALQKQLANIESRTGVTIAKYKEHIAAAGLEKHGQIIAFLKEHHGLTHGDANAVAKQAVGGPTPTDDEIYAGPKAHLKPVHDRLIEEFRKWGEFEVHPKKGYVALRRKKQFAMVGPATNTKLEIGLNMKGVTGGSRLIEQAPGGMCQYKVRLESLDEVDAELLGWVKQAFDSAG